MIGALRFLWRRFSPSRHRILRLEQDHESYVRSQWRCPPKEFVDPRLRIASGLCWSLARLEELGISKPVLETEGKAAGQLIRNEIQILDAGSRDGWTVELLASLGYPETLGVELLEDYVEYARKRGRNVVQGDLHNLVFSDEAFDFVHCRHSLEHSQDPVVVLTELLRVTRRGGAVYVSFPLERRVRGKHPTAIPTLVAVRGLLLETGVDSEVLYLGHSTEAAVVPDSSNEAILFVRRPAR